MQSNQPNPKGCVLIATNKDTFDTLDGRQIPGNGALVASVEACSGQEAVVTGKPSQLLGEMIVEKFGMDKSRTCVLGDRFFPLRFHVKHRHFCSVSADVC